ncbi:homoserine kinase [Alicyclobacillus shizuokensis]|uniref:homoserine kinase n=1 Tax=Alicyclobacillus shizuokensis TaxID=392014 RepID=UPI000AE9EB87|nr:homoserine kinase [Alicyclobacillus shizuokensis]
MDAAMTARDQARSTLRLRVRVPATSANLGPGFDCMGLALALFNEIEVETGRPFAITMEGEAANQLPLTRDNVIVQAMELLFERAGTTRVPADFCIRAHNHIPIAAGLGSSASAIVGGLLLGNGLVQHFDPERALDDAALLKLATELEGHPDNVAPALFGGGCLCTADGYGPPYTPLPIPEQLVFAVGVPNFPLPTEKARKALPQQVSMADAVYNVAQAARLMLALASGQLDGLRAGFGDRLHEPYRRQLIPGFEDVRRAAVRQGAKALTLSGAGPSLLAWCDSEKVALRVADEMTLAWREYNVECVSMVLRPWLDKPRVERLAPQA